jgi:hypothetical protein
MRRNFLSRLCAAEPLAADGDDYFAHGLDGMQGNQ